MNIGTQEAVKDTSRASLFGAVSVILTYILNKYFVLPLEVSGAIVYLIWAILTYVDSKIHNTKTGIFKDVNGLVNF